MPGETVAVFRLERALEHLPLLENEEGDIEGPKRVWMLHGAIGAGLRP